MLANRDRGGNYEALLVAAVADDVEIQAGELERLAGLCLAICVRRAKLIPTASPIIAGVYAGVIDMAGTLARQHADNAERIAPGSDAARQADHYARRCVEVLELFKHLVPIDITEEV